MTVTDSPTSKSTTLTCGLPPLLLLGRRGEDLDDLVQRQRRRPRRGADEAGDARGVAHRAPRLVVEVHPHQDVAGEDLALHLLALAVLDLDDLFGRHLDLEDVVLHVERRDAALEVGLHLVLVAGVGVHDVPVADGGAQRAAQLLGRVLVLVGLLLSRLGRDDLSGFARLPRPRRPRPSRPRRLGGLGDLALGDLGRRLPRRPRRRPRPRRPRRRPRPRRPASSSWAEPRPAPRPVASVAAAVPASTSAAGVAASSSSGSPSAGRPVSSSWDTG